MLDREGDRRERKPPSYPETNRDVGEGQRFPSSDRSGHHKFSQKTERGDFLQQG